MKALYFETAGKPREVLRFGSRPIPTPAAGQVLIRVLASPINPADVYFIAGTYIPPVFPQIAGMDGVGAIVESNGLFEKNDIVAFRHPGAWAEYVAVPSSKVIRLPYDFPIEKGAQLILNVGTAWGMLDRVRLSAGDWLHLSAGASTVSKITSQIAHRRGLRVLSTIRRSTGNQSLQEYGVDAFIDLSSHKGTSLTSAVLGRTSGEGLAASFDSVGGTSSSAIIQAMKVGGSILVYGVLDSEPVSYHNSQIIYRQLRIEGFRINSYLESLPDMQTAFKEIIDVVRPESFLIDIHGKYRLEQFAAAIEESPKGKVLFVMY